LIRKVQAACLRLEEALPHLHVVPNVIKRILKLIREEYFSAVKNDEVAECGPESLQKMLKSGDSSVSDYKKQVADLKERVFEIIDELLMELDSASEEISKQALEHIHANEIVAEAGPVFSGQAMAAALAAAKIPTTVITDSAIFAMMARVNKVIIGTSSILADGGLMAVAGSSSVALAAKHYSVPCIVLAAQYKLTPTFLPESKRLEASCLVSPGAVLQGLEAETRGKVRCLNPLRSYVAPDLVTLLISPNSGYSPSYVYRMIGDLYHQEDRALSVQ